MNTATTILFYTFILSTLVMLFYYLYFFLRLSRSKKNRKNIIQPPLSIIISAKNEAVNLLKNVPVIMEQEYPEFELIVVNDSSVDDTENVLYQLKEKYDNLEITHLEAKQKTFAGKKLPLTLGIKKAKYNNLVFTDADCYPDSKYWLSEIGNSYSKDFLIAFSPYTKAKGLLNKIIRFDATQIGIQYLSFALAGAPYMAVGRNMAYKKDFFFEVGGFRSQYHIPSGDDDLFFNKFVSSNNYTVVTTGDSFISSFPKNNWSSWWKQKRRHLSTASHYNLKTKLLLGTYHFFQLIFYFSLILLLINQISLIIVLSIFLTKTIIQLLVSSPAYKKLKAPDLLALSPIYEPLLLLAGIFVTLSLRFSKKIKWK